MEAEAANVEWMKAETEAVKKNYGKRRGSGSGHIRRGSGLMSKWKRKPDRVNFKVVEPGSGSRMFSMEAGVKAVETGSMEAEAEAVEV